MIEEDDPIILDKIAVDLESIFSFNQPTSVCATLAAVCMPPLQSIAVLLRPFSCATPTAPDTPSTPCSGAKNAGEHCR